MFGMVLYGKYILFVEGCCGYLGKQFISQFKFDVNSDFQYYGIGIKELWEIDLVLYKLGFVVYGLGWLLDNDIIGGFFLYYVDNNQVVVGLIVDLNYSNLYISFFDEFQ